MDNSRRLENLESGHCKLQKIYYLHFLRLFNLLNLFLTGRPRGAGGVSVALGITGHYNSSFMAVFCTGSPWFGTC